MPAEKPSTQLMSQKALDRKSTKPIMERKRRARINSSLEELKSLIIDVHKKEHSKLEKADILEMTVKYLRGMQRHQSFGMPSSSPAEPQTLAKFTAGFSECAHEVSRYMSRCSDQGSQDTPVRHRLLSHLANCMTSLERVPSSTPNYPVNMEVPTATSHGIPLVPLRLPNGEIAFLFPPNGAHSPAHSSASGRLTPTSPSSRSPINVLGSSGILSPAASERSCSPSEATAFPFSGPVYEPLYEPVYEPISPVSLKQEPLNLKYSSKSAVSQNVWRPF